VFVPKDWRGVFDAIDSGNWAAAQTGIAALPKSVLTPVAKAELYTARGSPVVDLASLQALIAEAPELPQSEQLAAMAVKRGALTPPLIIGEKPIYSIGSAPYRYKAKPVLGEPYADQLRSLIDPLVKAFDFAARADDKVTRLVNFEVRYRTKGDFEIVVFKQTTGGLAAAIEAGFIDRTRLLLTLDELTKLRWMIAQAKEKLDELK